MALSNSPPKFSQYGKKYTLRLLVSSMAIFLYLLNIADAAFTHYWLANGLGEEMNPMMAWAWENGLFWYAKGIVMGFLCGTLFVLRKHPFARAATYASTVLYALIVGYHIGGYLWLH